MMKHITPRLTSFTLLWLSAVSYATPTVIAHLPGSQPMDAYKVAPPAVKAQSSAYQEPPATIAQLPDLPLATPGLTPGEVTPRTLSKPNGLPPLFLIGADARSRQWVDQQRAALRQHGAIGLVVNVDTPAQLADLRQHAHPLPLMPFDARELASQLALQHYPVLMTPQAITQ